MKNPYPEISIGNDLVYLPRFALSCTPEFIKRVYTQNELNYCHSFQDPVLRYASTWAAKESIYKALKQSPYSIKLWWRDIEILRDSPQGKPRVNIEKLSGQFQSEIQFSLSISHDGDYAWAIALCFSNLDFKNINSRT